MFLYKEEELKLKEIITSYINTDFGYFEAQDFATRKTALRYTLDFVRNMTMETAEDAAFRVPAVDFCDRLLMNLANDPTPIDIPEEYREVFTFSPLRPYRDQELIKEKNLNGYFLAKITGGVHHLCFGSTDIDYTFLRYVPDIDFQLRDSDLFSPTPEILRKCFEIVYENYIKENADKIDIMILPELQNVLPVIADVYKRYRPDGKYAAIIDVVGQRIDLTTGCSYPEEIQNYLSYADVVTFPSPDLRDAVNGDPKNKFPAFTLRHSFYNATNEDINVKPEDKENIILTAGNISLTYKNVLSLVSAFSMCADKIPDWKLVLVGFLTEDIKKQIKIVFPNIKDRIEFPGNLDKSALYEQYRRAKIFCMPTFADCSPNVCSEAMAFGCYQVFSDSMDGAEDLTRNGEYGIVYEQEKYITHPKLFEYKRIDGYSGEAEKNLAAALVTAANKLDCNFEKDFIKKSKNLQRTEFDYDINARILALLLFG
jgi:glycosyltransferase involved in cell wall biosynthesis